MARIIVLLAIAFLGYLLWKELKQRSAKQRRQLLLRGGFFGLLAIILVLTATGRVHWIMAALAAMLPFAKILFSLLLRALPFLQVWMKHRQSGTGPSNAGQSDNRHSAPPQTYSELSEDEAWKILGLEPDARREDIVLAHKRLIQKLHPDRGGNDYLAAKLNTARDLLLKIVN